jgi:hypothetical protein
MSTRRSPGGSIKKDDESYPLPLPGDHTPRTVAGWADRGSDFIPAGRPDVHEHIEHGHDWLSQSAGNRAVKQASMSRVLTPKTSGGRAYFSREGWYVPAGNEDEQPRWLTKYQNESDSIEAATERGIKAMGVAAKACRPRTSPGRGSVPRRARRPVPLRGAGHPGAETGRR